MFNLYQHHDLETLAELLAALRLRAPSGSPLAPETIVVPNRGTARWLQAQLAESEGVAANLRLPVPGRFVWQVLRDALPGRPDSSAFERDHLVWHLYALLPGVDVPEVRRYLAAEPRERQRYQLAVRLAEVFDQYLIHRRDVLAEWEQGREAETPPAHWQAPVWRTLVARLGERHRARLLAELLALAEDGELDTAELPDPVYAFALSDLPADYLRLLHALGRYVDVHFFVPNPSAAYWGDVRRRTVPSPDSAVAPSGLRDADVSAPPLEDTGHPLLASLGRTQRDLLRVLYSEEFAGIHEPELGEQFAYREPGTDSLLHRVQSGIIAGQAQPLATGMAEDDVSIQMHACHGPLREVQVLHDRLLDLLARHAELEPRNILVLLPNPSRYAPAVYSVFEAARGSGRWIPYAVADRPRLDTHPIAQTFRQLLELPLSRWTASEVLALAGVPAVMHRFELDDGDLARLRHWIAAAGVRWGLDAGTREAAGAGRFEQNTWRFGLDRLLLGLAQQADTALVDGVAPWSDLEGDSAAAVGRLWRLVECLRVWRDRLVEPTTAAAWQEQLNGMVAELFSAAPNDPDEAAAMDTVADAIAALTPAGQALDAEPMPWEVVREALLGALAAGSQRQPLVTGGVTFAGMEPLRGVPFDIICLLGMDDDAFPRQDGERGLNLLERHPRTGDPSVRDADRMAFLQALTAARRCFYVSYTGRDVADGTELQPSTVVGELLDFLHGHYFPNDSRETFRTRLVINQPLHPFSPRYFMADDGNGARPLFTFIDHWRRAAAAQQADRREPEPFLDGNELPGPDSGEPIELMDLQRFFQHPAKWFFRERLRLELGDDEAELADEEPRALGALALHDLRERLFRHASEDGLERVESTPSPLERARGVLPPPPLGGAEYAAAAGDVNLLLPLHHAWRREAGTEEDAELDLTLPGDVRLVGRVRGVSGAELRRMRPGRLGVKHLLPWWLEYLALAAGGRDMSLRVAGVHRGALHEQVCRVDRETALEHLHVAVDHFRNGCRRPLLFEPYLAERYFEERGRPRTPKDPDGALRAVNGWLSRRRDGPHQAVDPWLQPLLGPAPAPLGASAAESSFATVAEAVAGPVLACLQAPRAST